MKQGEDSITAYRLAWDCDRGGQGVRRGPGRAAGRATRRRALRLQGAGGLGKRVARGRWVVSGFPEGDC